MSHAINACVAHRDHTEAPSSKATAVFELIGIDHAGQDILQGPSFTFREGGHDTVPHRQGSGVQTLVQVVPRWSEANEA